jgi:hypothetical protein
MSAPSPSSRFHSLSAELKALAIGHWQLFRQEMSGKVSHTRQQSLWMAAGALTALTAILLVLAGLTLLLSQLFVSQAGWQPLTAGGVSSLTSATIFALTGWLVFRNSSSRLRTEGLTPDLTLHSLKTAAQALSNQPVTPNPIPTAMNTRQNIQDALHQTAETVEYQARRAGRAVQETASSFTTNFDPGAFFTAALAWTDTVLTPRNRALAGRALGAAAAFPRRHPVPAAILGLGALYALWRRSKGTTLRDTVEDFATTNTQAVKDCIHDTRRSASNGAHAAAAAGRDIRNSLFETAATVADTSRAAASQFGKATTATVDSVREVYENARHSVAEGADRAAETARQLREDAEAGYKKAREFAKEEPALVIAGGVALALGALLLVKSSRR